MEISLKKCINCNLELPITDFSKDRRSKDGRKNICDICLERLNLELAEQERREKLIEKYREKYINKRLYCKKCEQPKNIDDYYISVKKDNTVFKLCKDCHKERDRKKREQEKEKRIKRIKKIGY